MKMKPNQIVEGLLGWAQVKDRARVYVVQRIGVCAKSKLLVNKIDQYWGTQHGWVALRDQIFRNVPHYPFYTPVEAYDLLVSMFPEVN